jgi:hypothetical protein
MVDTDQYLQKIEWEYHNRSAATPGVFRIINSNSGKALSDGKVDVSNLASGLYVISATDGQKTFRQKFIKEQRLFCRQRPGQFVLRSQELVLRNIATIPAPFVASSAERQMMNCPLCK